MKILPLENVLRAVKIIFGKNKLEMRELVGSLGYRLPVIKKLHGVKRTGYCSLMQLATYVLEQQFSLHAYEADLPINTRIDLLEPTRSNPQHRIILKCACHKKKQEADTNWDPEVASLSEMPRKVLRLKTADDLEGLTFITPNVRYNTVPFLPNSQI